MSDPIEDLQDLLDSEEMVEVEEWQRRVEIVARYFLSSEQNGPTSFQTLCEIASNLHEQIQVQEAQNNSEENASDKDSVTAASRSSSECDSDIIEVSEEEDINICDDCMIEGEETTKEKEKE